MEQLTQRCPTCEQTLPLDVDHFHRDKNRPRGFVYQCKGCKAKYEAARPSHYTYKSIARAKDYGMTPEQYKALEASQDGRCAICHSGSAETLHIDHDHETGVVRGLLCNSCNVGLGHFKDSHELLAAALEYLKWHGQTVKPDHT